jgi:signal transduction histidine kinase
MESTGTDRIADLLRTAWEFRESEKWEEMLALAEEARSLSEQIGFRPGLPRSIAVRAFVHYIRADFPTALSEAIEALQLAAGDLEAECRARSVLAMVHWSLGNYEEALNNGERTIELLDRMGDRAAKAFALTIKGGILLSLGQPDEALRWHQRSIEEFKAMPEEAVGRARAMSGLGLAYLAQQRSQEALPVLLEALQIAQAANHRITISRIFNDLGEVFEALQNDDQALRYHQDALAIRVQDGYRQAETTSLLALGRIHVRRKEYDRALELLERGLGLARELEIRPRIAQFHHTLADAHQQLGQLAPALHHFMEAETIRSSLDVDQAALRYKAVVFESQLESLQRRAELEGLASLGRLVAAITHEINSPLGAIQSSANLTMLATEKLLETHDAKAISTLRVNAKIITEASRRISELVARLKLLAGTDRPQYSRVDIADAINDVVNLLRPEFAGRVSVSVECETAPSIYAYATELYQVFVNLLRNSVQAIDGDGAVTIRITSDDKWFRISFTDTGHGIDDSVLPKLFVPDFHSDSGRVRASLGLFASMSVVKKHRGDIRVESEVGNGSTFTVLLPRSLEQSHSAFEAGDAA